MSRIRDKVNIEDEFNRFEFIDLLLLGRLSCQGKGVQSVLLFTPAWREGNWIYKFPSVLALCEI